MAALAEITEFLEPLALTIRGKVYEIPPLPYEDGLRFTSGDADAIDALTPEQFRRTFLGEALDRMAEDNVPMIYVARAALTALADFQGGRKVAEAMWASGGDPKALQAWVAKQKRAQPQDRKPKGSTRSRSTAGATTTP
jgi:hypothetical protein